MGELLATGVIAAGLYWRTGRRERWNLSLRKEPPSLEGRLLSPHGLMDKVGSNRAEPKLTA